LLVKNYILDACAILAFLNNENGADVVNVLIVSAGRGEITLSMNAANIIEVYYDRIRATSSEEADDIIRNIYENFTILWIRPQL